MKEERKKKNIGYRVASNERRLKNISHKINFYLSFAQIFTLDGRFVSTIDGIKSITSIDELQNQPRNPLFLAEWRGTIQRLDFE